MAKISLITTFNLIFITTGAFAWGQSGNELVVHNETDGTLQVEVHTASTSHSKHVKQDQSKTIDFGDDCGSYATFTVRDGSHKGSIGTWHFPSSACGAEVVVMLKNGIPVVTESKLRAPTKASRKMASSNVEVKNMVEMKSRSKKAADQVAQNDEDESQEYVVATKTAKKDSSCENPKVARSNTSAPCCAH